MEMMHGDDDGNHDDGNHDDDLIVPSTGGRDVSEHAAVAEGDAHGQCVDRGFQH